MDTNILISAILKEGLTRYLLCTACQELLLPAFSLHELERHRAALCKRTGLSSRDFVTVLETLLNGMHIVKKERSLPHFAEAARIIDPIDPDDIHFIACCLAHPGSVLWSDDKRLKEQSAVVVLTTQEMKASLDLPDEC